MANVQISVGFRRKACLHASRMLARSFVGSPLTVRAGLEAFMVETGVDELMVACAVYDHAARRHSYELLADVMRPQANRHAAG